MMATLTNTIEQQSLKQDFTTDLIETSFDVLNDIELDDLETMLTTEIAQGLSSDTEFGIL
ncbi:hypothetical protein JYQ62_30655 [Nostoc sp. UHCC 0702]|nr:hypothetical protein JYQ62_30655 [Nostoc sp. UHCC 0702]